jgi:excisionase family DNA binding protein
MGRRKSPTALPADFEVPPHPPVVAIPVRGTGLMVSPPTAPSRPATVVQYVLPPATQDDWQQLSVNQAAALLGIHPSTLYELVRRGDIIPTRQGRRKTFTRIEVQRYIAARMQGGAA